MLKFVVRRILWTIPIILLVIFMTFWMMRAIQGSPFRRTDRAVPPAVMANLNRKFGLDKPWYVQYAMYVKDVATFDLGPSLVLRDQDVNAIVKEHFPVSAELGGLAMLLAIVVGVPLGIIAALRANKPTDYAVMFFANLGFAVPSFLVSTLLIYYFAAQLGWFPTNGWDTPSSKVLPVIALSLGPLTYFARIVRGQMLETLQQDYVRTAKAKGLRWKRVVTVHVLRNSLIPAVTAAGPLLGFLVTGSFIIENIFAIPGIGRYYVTSVSGRDYSTVMGITVLLAILIIVANMFVDILYGFLDPADPGRPHLMVANPQNEEIRELTVAREREDTTYAAGAAVNQTSLWRDALRRFVRNRGALIALVAFVIMLGYVVLVPWVSPLDPNAVDFSQAYLSPSWSHPFGTDEFGRDLFLRTALGGRISIGIGFAGTVAIMVIGILYGAISGFVGGQLDNVAMRLLDALYGLPYLPFAIITLAIFGTVNFWTMVVALTIASWFTTARVMRGQIISLKENDYVRSAHAIGARWHRVLFRHLLPNTLGLVIVFVFLELPGVVLGEAFLSFLGLGINPPQASWGSLAQDGYTQYLSHPYIIVIPSVAIAWLILSAFFIADGLRDALDPRTNAAA